MSATIKHINIKGTEVPIIFEEQKDLPILNLQLVFQNSGYIQDKDKSGLVNLSSSILNEGTKELGSSNFAQILDENAITIHSSNGFETFVIEVSSLKEQSKKAVSLLNDLLKSPNFTQSSLDKIKTIQTGYLKRKENDFDFIAQNQLKALLFKDTALENPSSGTIESISKIELKDIENFLSKTISLNNLIIVAGGNFTQKEIETLIKPILENLKTGEKSEVKKIDFKSQKSEKTLQRDTEQAYIYFGSSFNIDSKDEENYKAKVASFILGGSGFGSRLMEEIRVKRGLAYSAYGNISINKTHTYFSGYLQTKNETAKEAQELVSKLVDEFVENGVTQEELTAAKNFLLGSEPLRNETLAQRLNKAFTLYYRGLDQDYSKKELEKIQNLKLEDLNNYIKSHKEINNLTFSIVRR
ncbi:M16 family metallopeptidase [Aliarcobacter butzleri]|uniref:Pitrilysin family protein n=1 Tax=Aliarcobacter butzleri TaxID=28197 RepID=A0AAW6VH70_9BACT|nr:pitrilysin family protein [Aliarcobacter butzleri]MCG3670258.1 insulinase family protein [Aliarcobacter butzleri]MCG3671326.1 insulinase family protein [Aliarcobacter butzleri]MCG3679828.1 insulinase family protein [Aliarcobacter butzleri]MCG3689794.1 insulinase family protein [Aliarcobacter butzleri]MCG3696689.1 insulinase family protein [Aliarcobacter butzleri]